MAVSAPVQVIPLKTGVPVLSAITCCRSCFIKNGLHHKPHMAYCDEQGCAVKGCENPSAYMVALSPFEISK